MGSDSNHYILFEDGTIGKEGEIGDSGTMYRMKYDSVEHISGTLEYDPDKQIPIPDWGLIGVILAPLLFLYFSIRNYVPITIPFQGEDTHIWVLICLFYGLVILALLRSVGVVRIRIKKHTESSTSSLEMASPTYLALKYTLFIAIVLIALSWNLSDSWEGSKSLDFFVTTFILLFLLQLSRPEAFPLPLLTRRGTPVDVLTPLQFFNKAEIVIEGQREFLLRQTPTEKLVSQSETGQVEFKASYWTDSTSMEKNKKLEDAVVKEVAGFLNTKNGGFLLLGIHDDPPHDPTGLIDKDIEHIGDRDKLLRHIDQILQRDLQIGTTTDYLSIEQDIFRGEEIIRITIPKMAQRPILALQPNRGSGDKKKEFSFVRSGSRTEPLNRSDWSNYIRRNWSN
tara:strand:+ start:586 stop:1773 length:1188 start_codon:yes stop_codon:yes gene_type:complete